MSIRFARAAACAIALAAAPFSAIAEELPRAAPGDVGLSADRLARLDARLGHEVSSGKIPGGIITIVKDGKIVHQTTMGALTEGGPEMTEDAIFRIYSMTKPIVSVAALMLMEQGRLPLFAPVSAFIPEFKDTQVFTGEVDDEGAPKTAPARRAMTVQDLLRHTSGLTYGFFGAGPVREAYRKAGVGVGGIPGTAQDHARQLAALPLEHEPGTTWEYSRSTDVLGAVLEVVTGKPLGELLEEMIFTPLDMQDTGFFAPESKHARLAEPKEGDGLAGNPLFDQRSAPEFESGGGGLVSTARDYARFAEFLLNGGELDGVRLLGKSTVEFMTSDHLGANIKPGKYYLPGAGAGFGLGVGVRTERGVGPTNLPVGAYWWGGAGGTYWYNVPGQDMAVIWMMQSPSRRVPLRPVLIDMVQAAVE
ncbi:serine hydrolase domain-containing protein [Rhodovulum sp. DZ06]|uniref:serine hydrolase domain-containing protein n=1 Tax=Rhodovulum sp. DZ06 TaxID=3425126 RepID=UPI003D32C7C2